MMNVLMGHKSPALAKELRKELARGRFHVGDQFYTISAICRQHGVSTRTAMRCVGQLAREGLLSCVQGAGTYVERLPENQPTVRRGGGRIAGPASVDLIMPEDLAVRIGSRHLQNLLSVVNDHLTSHQLAVRLNWLPGRLRQRNELSQWFKMHVDGGTRAFIFLWLSQMAQEIARDNKWPTCVLGHPDAGIDLPFIDDDRRQMGQLVSDYLIQHDCRRVALATRAEWRPGDNIMFNSLLQGLGNRLIAIESTSQTESSIDNSMMRLLESQPPIDALIVKCEPGRWLPANVDRLLERTPPLRIVHCEPEWQWSSQVANIQSESDADAMKKLASCIESLLNGQQPSSRAVLSPVRLIPPQGLTSAKHA